jgi:glycosyltransferase involved in cell wall biosynthesis
VKPMPRVSVGIPVYNGERYLRTAVDSVLQQDYEDLELILCDNVSTDGTGEICREYEASDRRVRYVRNERNIGAVPNFNRVFELSRGEFFKWLPYDDTCSPTFLRRAVEVFDEVSNGVSLVFPYCAIIGGEGEFHTHLIEDVATTAARPYQRLWKVLLRRRSAQALCGLIRATHLRKTKLRGSYVMDDMGLLAELSMIGGFVQIPEVLLQIRAHSGNARMLYASTRSHAVWLDPANAASTLMLGPQTRLFLESFRSVVHVPIRPLDRLLCFLSVPAAYCDRVLRDGTRGWRKRILPEAPQPDGTGRTDASSCH